MELKTELRERAMEFMTSVARRSADPFYTVSPKEGFRLVFVNEAACHHFGRRREELLNLTLADLDSCMPPQQWSRIWAEVREKGAIFFETVHRHADGRDIPVAVSANHFAQGGRELFGGCIHDLRPHEEAQEAVRESEEMLRIIFNSSYDGILLHTGEGKILDANEPFLRMHGIGREQMLRLSIADLSSPDMPMEEAPAIWARVLDGNPQMFEWKARRVTDGTEFDVEIFLRRVRVRGQEVILANLRDITARKQFETELRQAKEAAEEASRAKDRFLLNMSHELRTPLTVAMGMLELALQEASSPSLRRHLGLAYTSSEALLTLVSDILELSRIEKGESILDEQPFDLHRCLRESLASLAPRAEANGIRLALNIDASTPARVVGDGARLRQILDNLVANAIRFSGPGEVTVSTFAEEPDGGVQMVHFAVRDSGIGIPVEALERIFKKFTQVDDSLTRRYGGSGLGLAISRGLVERMGGRIAVESEEGKGSIFSFVLPLRVAQVTAAAELPADVGGSARKELQPACILLVEDEPSIRELMRTVLKTRGWQVEEATSGREAVARCQEEKFDLVLMDVQMPEMDGLEATRRIRELESGRGEATCIIALTAHAGKQTQEECFNTGMNGFLAKPVRIGDLYAAVDQCLSRKSAKPRPGVSV